MKEGGGGEGKCQRERSVHWSGYDATTVDIEVDPQRCRFGSRKSDFALQALVECRALCFITAGPSTKLFACGEGGILEDMCYERRRAEACVTGTSLPITH